ncbi:MAG TPA: DUF542 domain-containing protein [Nitrospirota bacterium]
MSKKITEEMSLNDVVRKYPQTIAVMNRFKIDSCCGGSRSVGQTIGEDKLDAQEFLKALNEAADKAA